MFKATTFKGKRVGLFGLARSGISCASALAAGGADVFAWDDNDVAVAKAASEGLPVKNLHEVDFAALDALVLSPGVPLTHPQPHWSVVKAKKAGVEIIGDTEVFAREMAPVGARMVAITGTNGKSTTTALIGHVLKTCGQDVDVGGNIGLAVSNLRQPEQGRIYVLELSSFQIDLMPSLKPDVGVLTNITPDHLDRHGTIENYASVKARMFEKLGPNDVGLIGVDEVYGREIALTHPSLLPVSVVRDLPHGISAPHGILRHVENGTVIAELDLSALPALKGRHNWQNACMAYGVGHAFGLKPEAILAAMERFPGLAHRMQQVGQLGPVVFVNDSKATNADAAEKALATYDNIYWIAGGIAKAGGIEPLQPHFGNISKAYLIGAAAEDFSKTLAGNVEFEICGTLDVAVANAARAAASSSKPNPVVLLSPACASFDHYKNFEVRGEAFVAEVAKLPSITLLNGGKHGPN